MGSHITLTASDGHSFDAYRADPAGTPKGGIVVIQEIFGVNSHIRAVADSYAEQGYVAIAPAMFDRLEKNFETGYEPDDIELARGLMDRVSVDDGILDLTATVAKLKEDGLKIGVVGYCWGGSMTWLAATRIDGVAAGSSYYGGFVSNHLDEAPRCPVIFHFGEIDQSIPMEKVEQVKAGLPDQKTFVYPAGHGFNCDHRGSYDAESAALATERTLALFAEHVG